MTTFSSVSSLTLGDLMRSLLEKLLLASERRWCGSIQTASRNMNNSDDSPPEEEENAPSGECSGLHLAHAHRLRELLQHLAESYDLQSYRDRPGPPRAWGEGVTAACALKVDPGPVIAGMLSVLEADQASSMEDLFDLFEEDEIARRAEVVDDE